MDRYSGASSNVLERLLRRYGRAQSRTPSSITTLEVFKKAGEATVILGALFYVVGWSSLDAYYTAFGLNLAQLPISMLDGTTASLRVFFHDFVSLLVLVGLPLVGIGVRQLPAKLAPDPTALSLILIFLTAGGLSIRARDLGERRASVDMINETTTLPRAQFGLIAGKIDKDIVNLNEFKEPYYVVLIQTSDRIWAFKPLDDSKIRSSVAVLIIPKDAVNVVRLQLKGATK
jgi:hypothetical protein